MMTNPNASVGTAFRIVVPVAKAVADADDGCIRHAGVISDSALDLQGDVVPQDLLTKSFPYLTRHGKFNWDHGPEDIGDVLAVHAVTPQDVQEKWGMTIQKGGTAIEGTVYPIVDVRLASTVLKTAHHRMRAGARLAYSLDGVAVRKSDGAYDQLFVPRCAITPQPVNPNTFCQVVTKSLAGVLEHVGITDADLPHVLADLQSPPNIMLDCDPLEFLPDTDHVLIGKALFGHLVRRALGARNAPPLGGLAQALENIRARGR